MKVKVICERCNKDIPEKITEQNQKMLRASWGDSKICGDCFSEGWRFCTECKSIYNVKDANQHLFQIEFDLSVDVSKPDNREFCSNVCFNIKAVDNEIEKRESLIAIIEAGLANLHFLKDEDVSKYKEYAPSRIKHLKELRNKFELKRESKVK